MNPIFDLDIMAKEILILRLLLNHLVKDEINLELKILFQIFLGLFRHQTLQAPKFELTNFPYSPILICSLSGISRTYMI